MGQSWAGWTILAGFIVVLLVFVTKGPTSTTDPAPALPPQEEERATAIQHAKQYVAARLKSPSTAKFPTDAEFVAYDVGYDWTVKGYVDSQNSFGAVVRATWKCDLRVKDNSVTLINVAID